MIDNIFAYILLALILFLIVGVAAKFIAFVARFGGRISALIDGPRRRAAYESQIRALEISDIDNMDGHDFEDYTARLLRHEGYTEVEVTPRSGDFGVDIVASKNGHRHAIQVKRQTRSVSRRAVSDAVAGMRHFSCDAAMVVTNSYLTKGARVFASSVGCEIVDRDDLSEWILRYQNAGLSRSLSPESRAVNTSSQFSAYIFVGAVCLFVVTVVGWSWYNKWKGNDVLSHRSSAPVTRIDTVSDPQRNGQENYETLSPIQDEIRAWNRIRNLRRGAAHFEAFLEAYPDGQFAVKARQRLKELLAENGQRKLETGRPDSLNESPATERPIPATNNLSDNDKQGLRTGIAYVTANRLNVRLAPDPSGKITIVLDLGEKVNVLEVQGDWARISHYYDGSTEGLSGGVARWVAAEYLSDSRPVHSGP